MTTDAEIEELIDIMREGFEKDLVQELWKRIKELEARADTDPNDHR
jgi:hypothetical protein